MISTLGVCRFGIVINAMAGEVVRFLVESKGGSFENSPKTSNTYLLPLFRKCTIVIQKMTFICCSLDAATKICCVDSTKTKFRQQFNVCKHPSGHTLANIVKASITKREVIPAGEFFNIIFQNS